eukprot:scaffold16218_cov88-Isochrysis_galbana.AAC.2
MEGACLPLNRERERPRPPCTECAASCAQPPKIDAPAVRSGRGPSACARRDRPWRRCRRRRATPPPGCRRPPVPPRAPGPEGAGVDGLRRGAVEAAESGHGPGDAGERGGGPLGTQEHRPRSTSPPSPCPPTGSRHPRAHLFGGGLGGPRHRPCFQGVHLTLHGGDCRVLRRLEAGLALALDAAQDGAGKQREEADGAQPHLGGTLGPRTEPQRPTRQPRDAPVRQPRSHSLGVDVAAAGAVEEVDVLGPAVAGLQQARCSQIAPGVQDRHQDSAPISLWVRLHQPRDACFVLGHGRRRELHNDLATLSLGPCARPGGSWVRAGHEKQHGQKEQGAEHALPRSSDDALVRERSPEIETDIKQDLSRIFDKTQDRSPI